MNNILLSLDPSTKSTGWAIFKNDKLFKYGAITEKSKDVLERILDISQQIDILIDKYNINIIAIENVQITMNAPTAKALLGLQLILELKAYKREINCELIRPTHWRKVLELSNSPKIKRADKKKEAQNYVVNKYNIPINSIDDICDAICIGECYIKEINQN